MDRTDLSRIKMPATSDRANTSDFTKQSDSSYQSRFHPFPDDINHAFLQACVLDAARITSCQIELILLTSPSSQTLPINCGCILCQSSRHQSCMWTGQTCPPKRRPRHQIELILLTSPSSQTLPITCAIILARIYPIQVGRTERPSCAKPRTVQHANT